MLLRQEQVAVRLSQTAYELRMVEFDTVRPQKSYIALVISIAGGGRLFAYKQPFDRSEPITGSMQDASWQRFFRFSGFSSGKEESPGRSLEAERGCFWYLSENTIYLLVNILLHSGLIVAFER